MESRPAYFGSHRMPQLWLAGSTYSGARSVRKVTEVRPHQPLTISRLPPSTMSGAFFRTG